MDDVKASYKNLNLIRGQMHADEGYGITGCFGSEWTLKLHTNHVGEESQAEFWSEFTVSQ